MSTNEPPVPPGEPPHQPAAPPPPAYGQYPTPGAPGPAAPGVPRPGELLDRFLARLIDGVLLGIVYGILSGIATAVFVSGYRSSGEAFLYWTFLSILSTAAYMAYFVYLESNNGATLGKQLLKLKVVGPDGTSNPTVEQAARRNIFMAFGLLGIVPIVGSLIGGLASLAAVIMIAVGINGDTVARQAWHDKFAGGTRVLKIG
jgi:uncharacterized RDD family membrane protein YckC